MYRIMIILFLWILVPLVSLGQSCRKTTVYFNFGKVTLKKQQLLVVDSLLNSLHPDTTYLIELHGHTDEWGSEENNMELSKERVRSVMKEMGNHNNISSVRLPLYFGELNPASDKRALNRRVSLYILPVNNDGTITVHGDNGVQMRTPVGFFYGCGVCQTNPRVASIKQYEEGKPGGLNVKIEADCNFNINCYSVEFRFPYEYFNESETVKMPRPVYVTGCGDPRFQKDSVNVKENSRYKIRFDTLSNEYIVTHDCYRPYSTMCCGTRSTTMKYEVILPTSIENKKTFFYVDVGRYDTLGNKTHRDTLFKETKDTFNTINRPDTLFGSGFFNGELLFLQEDFSDLPQTAVYSEQGFYDYTEIKVPFEAYRPLNYKDTVVEIKLPRTMEGKVPGYYIEAVDYFIPFYSKRKLKFCNRLLDYRFEYAVKEGDSILVILTEQMKVRRKKWKAKIKVRVKR